MGQQVQCLLVEQFSTFLNLTTPETSESGIPVLFITGIPLFLCLVLERFGINSSVFITIRYTQAVDLPHRLCYTGLTE